MLEIVTERLVLRPLQFGDVPAFATYRSDPDVARYQSWDTTYSTADADGSSPLSEMSPSATKGHGCSWRPSTG